MKNLVVVSEPKDWILDVPDAEVVAARDYLSDPRYTRLPGARVFNLCRSYRYQRTGYYVSLLAEARGHRPMPGIRTIQDLKSPPLLRSALEDVEDPLQKSLEGVPPGELKLHVYFGQAVARNHAAVARALFRAYPCPFLRASFHHEAKTGRWHLHNLDPIATEDVPAEDHAFVVEVTRAHFAARHRNAPRRPEARFDLAILVNAEEVEPPSDAAALRRFIKAGEAVGFGVELIGRDDYDRIPEFDALFLRETTAVNHRTFRFASKAATDGLVVIDDPESILRCTNKVFLAEVLDRHGVRTPRTRIVHRTNAYGLADELGLPCVLKQPDSAFSRGVVRVNTRDELEREVRKLLDASDLIVAQEYLPTEFDWRIGVLAGEPLYACRYYMARNHWQIIRRGPKRITEGKADTLAIPDAPADVIATAVKAARLMGDGLYGVDLKEIDGKAHVIEVNDNPSINAGCEDAVLKDDLYLRIMRELVTRVERKKRAPSPQAQESA